MSEQIWVARDYLRCSGCRRCEIACSLHHEGKVWPEASRIRVFMLIPGVEVPQLCNQCLDYPCVKACPVGALTTDNRTSAVLVDKEKCTGCGLCIDACPGEIPTLHPWEKKALICDLCGGEPECVKACQSARFNALSILKWEWGPEAKKLFARTPEDLTVDVAINLYGEKAEELV